MTEVSAGPCPFPLCEAAEAAWQPSPPPTTHGRLLRVLRCSRYSNERPPASRRTDHPDPSRSSPGPVTSRPRSVRWLRLRVNPVSRPIQLRSQRIRSGAGTPTTFETGAKRSPMGGRSGAKESREPLLYKKRQGMEHLQC